MWVVLAVGRQAGYGRVDRQRLDACVGHEHVSGANSRESQGVLEQTVGNDHIPAHEFGSTSDLLAA